MRHVILAVAAVVIISYGTGCATTSRSAGKGLGRIELSLTESGSLILDEKPVAPERLAAALKSYGATPETAILIDIPANTSPTERRLLTSRLATAGFLKVMFKGPRHATATIAPPPPPAPPGRGWRR